MKKKILIAGFIISSLAFADVSFKEKTNDQLAIKPITTTAGTGTTKVQPNEQLNLSEAQQKEFVTAKELYQKDILPLNIAVEERQVSIKNELSNKKINWLQIEALLKEKDTIESQIELFSLKNQVAMKEKFGANFNVGTNGEQIVK